MKWGYLEQSIASNLSISVLGGIWLPPFIAGHFVCKVFDLFTPFSVGLVYLMYRAFEKVSAVCSDNSVVFKL